IDKWYEEAVLHKNLFYKLDNNIIIFDFVKGGFYCYSEKVKEYTLEQIRIFEVNEYLKEANSSPSSSYNSLKVIN
ncbi:MAG: hypothetical protein JKY08_03960, partial [Flavobacteriaceae bacterium]|nr:hypothetical protein [Flavobacteriaceae bacterium]